MEGLLVEDAEEAGSERYTTSGVARVAGYSVQQVRDLERLGVIPPSSRRSNGYRRFVGIHVIALRAYRRLAIAVGPAVARATMSELRLLPHDEAVARVVALHTGLARARDDVISALRALDSIVDESTHDAAPAPNDSMTITELGAALGIRSSALRFWETQGLVTPQRPEGRNVRLYPPGAVREARIVCALRAAGYPIPTVQRVMSSLRITDDTADVRDALESRLRVVASKSDALLRAGSDIAELLSAISAPVPRPERAESPG